MPNASASASLEALVVQYSALIRRVIRRVGGRQAAAVSEDIEQVVVANLWRQLAREQTIDHPASYIYKVAVRETIRAIRREGGSPWAGAEPIDAEQVADPSDPHRQLEARELGKAIAECLAGFAPDRRRALRAHLAGFDVAEIMELYGWSYQRARNLIARGMAELRAALRDRGLP